jgi:putative ABC transport system ATP-binding protein
VSRPLVSITGAAKQWSPDAGLQPVDLEVSAGEVVVVRGRSGSGKSTLLALLAGWAVPDRGEIVFATGLDPARWSDLTIVPQVLGLVGELTVGEHLADALGSGRGRSLPVDRIRQVLDELGLAELVDRFPGEMSMGQRQRTAVARAVVGSPSVVLADEPTSHQDQGHAVAVVAALCAAAGRGAAVIVATHDPEMAASATRVIDLEAMAAGGSGAPAGPDGGGSPGV